MLRRVQVFVSVYITRGEMGASLLVCKTNSVTRILRDSEALTEELRCRKRSDVPNFPSRDSSFGPLQIHLLSGCILL